MRLKACTPDSWIVRGRRSRQMGWVLCGKALDLPWDERSLLMQQHLYVIFRRFTSCADVISRQLGVEVSRQLLDKFI